MRATATADVGWELRLVLALQALARHPVVAGGVRALGTAGEHAAVWMALALAGAATDRRRRRDWLRALTVIGSAHASAVAAKRCVRRRRPAHPALLAPTRTFSHFSCPSSHAASTTAASLVLGRLTGWPLSPTVPALMALARVAAGAHYPSDVFCGVALGWAVDRIVGPRARVRRSHRPRRGRDGPGRVAAA
jgi:membrane-associated phospholipid phosphatase